MPIDFACPECKRHYRVKDELAGKGAKCGKCGHKMQIPALQAAPSSATKSAAPAKPKPVQAAAKAPQPAAAPAKQAGNSWLDEELETSQPAISSAPAAAGRSCPSCGTTLAANAVLCVACGYDLRTRAKHETRHAIDLGEKEKAPPKKRSELSHAASLLRGTIFSFIAAILGAAIWAGLAMLTDREFGLVAWGLGGLVGFGMALGHEDDDGTFAGIIAAFMSLFGIVAAKIFIVVMVVAPMLAALANVEEIDPVEDQRELVASIIAEEKLEKQGLDPDDVTDEQWDTAMEAASAEVAGMSKGQLDKRAEQFQQAAEQPEKGPELVADEDAAAEGAAAPAVNNPALAAEDAPPEEIPVPGLVALFFAMMFSPIDGIFILLAFFTAYKVGSGVGGD